MTKEKIDELRAILADNPPDEVLVIIARWSIQELLDEAEASIKWNELYHELIFAVSSKFPGESRHATALRYIRQAESRESVGPRQEATDPPKGGRMSVR